MLVAQVEQFYEWLGCRIVAAKVDVGNPVLIVAGDLNRKPLDGAHVADEGPLNCSDWSYKRRNTFDIIYINEPGWITSTVMENVLYKLRNEMELDLEQYGGEKGYVAHHLVVYC